MAWQNIHNNPYWQYDDAPLDPGGAETALWATSTNGIRINASGEQIYVNCRHIPLHPTQDSFPNEINKTFWNGDYSPPQAGIINWNNAVTTSADTDVSTEGTSVYAYSLNGAGGTIALNGVNFTEAAESTAGVFDNLTSSVNPNQNATVFSSTLAPWKDLSTNYKAVLQGGLYNGFDDATYTLNGLTSGQDYLVQVWINDPRVQNMVTLARIASFYGEANNTSTTAKVLDYNITDAEGGLGQYIIGTFTADASSIAFFVEFGTSTSTDGGVQMNAIQVRAL